MTHLNGRDEGGEITGSLDLEVQKESYVSVRREPASLMLPTGSARPNRANALLNPLKSMSVEGPMVIPLSQKDFIKSAISKTGQSWDSKL